MTEKQKEKMVMEVLRKQWIRKGGKVTVLPPQKNKTIIVKARKASKPNLNPENNLKVSGWMRKNINPEVAFNKRQSEIIG